MSKQKSKGGASDTNERNSVTPRLTRLSQEKQKVPPNKASKTKQKQMKITGTKVARGTQRKQLTGTNR